MKIENDKIFNRAAVFNKDIQLGILAYAVAERVLLIDNNNQACADGKVTREKNIQVVEALTEYVASAKQYCDENELDWNVVVLMARKNLDAYVVTNSILDN